MTAYVKLNLDKVKGAFYGAILGDVIGVPYEFKHRSKLIGLTPDIFGTGLVDKTYPTEPFGVWSDDTSLILCLVDAYIKREYFIGNFIANMHSWVESKRFTATNHIFDIGTTTSSSIQYLKSNPNETKVPYCEDTQGNGALMRTLPCAFFPTIDTAIGYAIMQGATTHNSNVSAVCTVYYTIILWYVLRDKSVYEACQLAYDILSDTIYADGGELGTVMDFCKDQQKFSGSRWVVDSLGTSVFCAVSAKSTIESIQKAILYGDDTDTTACIAGGLAGAIHGFTSDLDDLRKHVVNCEVIDGMWERLKENLEQQNKEYTI